MSTNDDTLPDSIELSFFNKPCVGRNEIQCMLDIYSITYEYNADKYKKCLHKIGGSDIFEIYPSTAHVEYIVDGSTRFFLFNSGQELIQFLEEQHITITTPTCSTIKQIINVLKQNNISYEHDRVNNFLGNIDGHDCTIHPLQYVIKNGVPAHLAGNQPVHARLFYRHFTETFSTSDRLIGLLKQFDIVPISSKSQWMAIGRLATLVETLSCRH
jgi:hypothetical protein